jgi:hypothetical protein
MNEALRRDEGAIVFVADEVQRSSWQPADHHAPTDPENDEAPQVMEANRPVEVTASRREETPAELGFHRGRGGT